MHVYLSYIIQQFGLIILWLSDAIMFSQIESALFSSIMVDNLMAYIKTLIFIVGDESLCFQLLEEVELLAMAASTNHRRVR